MALSTEVLASSSSPHKGSFSQKMTKGALPRRGRIRSEMRNEASALVAR